MDSASVASRSRRPKRRLCVLDTDEWSALERIVNLVSLALDGLEERSRSSILEARRDVIPLVWLVLDLRDALGKFEIKAARATLPRPTHPAELTDPDRVVSA